MEYIKKYWRKEYLIILLFVVGILIFNVINAKSIVFYDEKGNCLEDNTVIEIEYKDGELLDVTAILYEKILNPEGTEISVEMKGEVDVMTLGEYPVVYHAKQNGRVEDRAVTYVVKDLTAPEITLEGGEEYVLLAGEEFEEPGFAAEDNFDGDLTEMVEVTGEPDPYRSFVLTYSVTDSNGNTSEIERHVSVEVGEDQKVMYLTFDDGPTAYTKRLLDVLDKYNVKATFFVTGNNEKYFYLIGEAFRRGHTIALHTYSHKYSIYSSAEDYYEDLQKIQDVVVEQTGQEATIIRFPGGTSNATSKNYCDGIMSFLVEDVVEKGYVYCDWNVSSGDGGGATDEATVIQNVMNYSARVKQAIVLQHDTQSFSVDAVDDIILYARSKGYVLLPLTEDSPMVQQNPRN